MDAEIDKLEPKPDQAEAESKIEYEKQFEEAIPIPATALLPIILFPILEVGTVAEATRPFANPLIYLFMGGFIIALAMERTNLHRRIALNVVNFVGVQTAAFTLGIIVSGPACA